MLTVHSRIRSERQSHLPKICATQKATTLNLTTDKALHWCNYYTPKFRYRAKASQSDGWKSHQLVFPRQVGDGESPASSAWLSTAVRMDFLRVCV